MGRITESIVTDLPLPDSPPMAGTSPGSTWKETSRTP